MSRRKTNNVSRLAFPRGAKHCMQDTIVTTTEISPSQASAARARHKTAVAAMAPSGSRSSRPKRVSISETANVAGSSSSSKDGAQAAATDDNRSWEEPTTEHGLSYALSFALTADQSQSFQRKLAQLGLADPPPPRAARSRSNSSTYPPTPTSYPSTPSYALPKGSSPFVPMTVISPSASTNAINGTSSSNQQAIAAATPKLHLAIDGAWEDAVLPLGSRAALRSYLIGHGAQALLQGILPGLLGRKSGSEAIRAIFSRSSARVGISFALFTFVYRIINYMLTFFRLKALTALPSLAPQPLDVSSHRARALARLIRIVRGNGIVPFFAALAASPALYLLPAQKSRSPGDVTFPRKTIALDLFTKGMQAHFDVLRKRRSMLVSWIPEWCDTALLYAVANGQLLWAFLFEPDCFPKNYGDFILARSSAYVPSRPPGLPSAVEWPNRRQLVDHIALLSKRSESSSAFPSFLSPSLSALHPSSHPTTSYDAINPVLDWSPAHPAHSRLLCAMLHPTEPSCKTNYLHYWASEFKQSAKFVAMFTAVFNLFKLRSWKRDPEGSLFRFVMSVVQGATVISGSIATAWGMTCFFQHYLPRNFIPRFRFFLNGFLASVFIYAVPASRRAQLGLYVGRMSMDSTWQILAKHRKVRTVRSGDVALLSLGLAMLASLYEDKPYALSGYLRRIMRTMVGPRLSGTPAARAGLPADAVLETTSETTGIDMNALDSRLRNGKSKAKAS